MSFVVPNYKISAFDPERGSITINFEGYTPVAYQAPFVDSAYLSGANLHMWIKGLFSSFAYSDIEVAAPVYSEVSNADAVSAMVDTTPF